ncbi:MAG TPA: DUF4159 domain-containing protein [Terrimicrobiaceae bacterium]
MAKELPVFLQKVLDKFSNSRDFTISFALHALLIALFGGTVLYRAVQEPPDFEGETGGFVQPNETAASPSAQQAPPQETTFNVASVAPSMSSPQLNTITTTAVNALDFTMSPVIAAPINTPTTPTQTAVAPPTTTISSDGMSTAAAAQIKAFTQDWGKSSGPGTSTRSREFEFTAYIGQYSGGNWSSTVRITEGNKIETGSLPNLLYLMSAWSKDKIKTNYKSVQAIKLDSDEIFSVKPPFIFLTGTRDFKLSDKEVENLQKYVRMGGCIWGDSSLPGLRSRFDIAFRREMKRVISDVDKNFEPLPSNHPIYTEGYFADVKEVPPGLNFYKLPVFAMKIYGEIAILYTANDYGDMWQIGLNQQGQIDMRKNAEDKYIAINSEIFDRRDVYLRNIEPAALSTCFKFGTNVVIHLLTRWESKVRTAPGI